MAFNDSAYSDVVITNGAPAQYLKLERHATTTVNGGSLLTAFNGTYVGPVDFKEGWIDKTCQALYLYEPTAYVNAGAVVNAANGFGNRISVEFWVKPSNEPGSKQNRTEVIYSQNSFSQNYNLVVGLDPSNKITVFHRTYDRLISKTPLKKDTWYHVVVVINGGRYYIYINGYRDNYSLDSTYSTNLEATNSFWGVYYTTSIQNDTTWMPFEGQLDEVALYTTPLEESYIKAHFNQSGLYDLTSLIETEHVKSQSKITKYDVEFAAPNLALTYKRSVISSNPIVYLKFDTPGTVASTNYGTRGAVNAGVYTGVSPTVSSEETVDVSDYAVKFTGGAGSVACGDIEYTNNSKVSVEIWAYLDDVNSPDRMIVSKSLSTNYDFVIYSNATGPNTYQVVFKANGVSAVVSNSQLNINQFYHIVAVVDGTEHKLYINGREDNTVTTATMMPYNASYNVLVGSPEDPLLTIGADTPDYWRGYLDEFAFYNYALSPLQIYEHFRLGYNGAVYEPEYDVDTAPVEITNLPTSYLQSIQDSGALHYWSMDETLSGVNTSLDDTGSATNLVNIVYSDPTDVAQKITSPIRNFSYAYRFDDGNYGYTTGAYKHLEISADARTAFSIEFWHKRIEENRKEEILLGWENGPTEIPFSIYFLRGFMYLYIQYSGIEYNKLLFQVDTGDWRQEGSWNHVAVTISNYGEIKAYCNGIQRFIGSMPDNQGLQTPTSSQYFFIGKNISVYDNVELTGVAGLAMFNRVVTSGELYNRYLLGKYGVGFTKRILNSAGATSGFYQATATDYSYLTNGLDITPLVENYVIETKLDTPINGAVLSLKQGWKSNIVEQYIPANSYVVIEERFTDTSGEYDSGWVTLGHFLNDGLIPTQRNTETKSETLRLSSPLKILTYDAMGYSINPDKLKIKKDNLVLTADTTDAYYFKKKRSPVPTGATSDDEYYYNWAESPAVRLYVSKFDMFYQGSDQAKILQDVSEQDEYVIRGAGSSLQVLGGEGTIIINKNYFESSFPEGGLGYPEIAAIGAVAPGVKAEFQRYATQADVYGGYIGDQVYITNVTSIPTTNDKWFITLSEDVPDIDGKTMFVKSGKAKGKIFKVLDPSDISQSGLVKEFSTASVGSTPVGSSVWINQDNIKLRDTSYAEWDVDSGYNTTGTARAVGTHAILSPTINANNISPNTVPTDCIIKGIVLQVKLRKSRKKWAFSSPSKPTIDWTTNLTSLKLQYGAGTYTTSKHDNVAYNRLELDGNATQLFDEDSFVTVEFGGENDLWGYSSWTHTIINSSDFGAQLQFTNNVVITPANRFVFVDARSGDADVMNPRIESIVAKVYYETIDGQSCYIVDLHGRVINPSLEGIQQLDYVQIGDCNRLEDALRKLFVSANMQENDPTKPFYFEIDQCHSEVLLPPLRYEALDNISKLDALDQIMSYAPPNYFVFSDVRTGHVRVANIVLDDNSTPTYTIDYEVEESKETLDFNVYTKVIAQGQASQSVNVALHQDYGGTSAVRAYKLDNFAASSFSDTSETGGYGETLSQANANDYIAAIFDNNSKSPLIIENNFDQVGVIYQRKGTSVKPIEMSEQDLFVLDIGVNQSIDATYEFEVDALQFVWFNTYRQGASINQSMYVDYMTEYDYLAEFGKCAPTQPDQADADLEVSYMPPINSKSWKPLIEEFNLDEGQAIISSSDFLEKKPLKLRFLKFRVGQPHYRFGLLTGDDTRISRITLSDVKVWTSNRILASAELGVTYPFNTGNDKEIAKRYRRRTYVMDVNPYLDTYESTKQFAVDELRERRQDFVPISITIPNKMIKSGDIVNYLQTKNYYNDEDPKNYLVTSSTSNSDNGMNTLILQNYDIE